MIYTVAPSLQLQSNWSTHALHLHAKSVSRFYDKFNTQDSTDYTVGADGRLDIVRGSSISGGVSYTDAFEPLADNPNAGLREPIEYKLTAANIRGDWALARTKLGVFVSSDTYDYETGFLFNGVAANQDDRDRLVTEYGGRVDYSISPDTALFLTAKGNTRDYDLAPPRVGVNRNSDGYEVLGGVAFDLTRLIRGEIGAGYMHQEYDAAGVGDTDDATGNVKIEWFPTQIMTITAKASRFVGDSGLGGASSFLGTEASLGADYELLRNVILSGEVGWGKDEYQGVRRDDERWTGSLGAEYMLNRVAGVYGRYLHWDQDSSGAAAGRKFKEDMFTIGVRLRR
jgi:hypothetical protein